MEKSESQDKSQDTNDKPKHFQTGIFPIRAYNHHVVLFLSLVGAIICVFCATFIEYHLVQAKDKSDSKRILDVILFAVSAGIFLFSSITRVITNSTIITTSKKAKHVPVIGKLSTLRFLVKVEPSLMFLEIIALNLGHFVQSGQTNQIMITSCVSVAIVAITVFIMCFQIPHIPILFTVSLFVFITSIANILIERINGGLDDSLMIASYIVLIVSTFLNLLQNIGPKYDIKTKRLSLAAELMKKKKLGVKDGSQLFLSASLILFYVQCFIKMKITLFK
ncbi:Hypothetical_protein [Hexamita inflata]|uniref:Hypothetical_protein n=1 Tax=Hexamita inflata TaxID=28002 RepID=A0AA86UQS9_9EUKA|nr:Hypothetical protein HINF_LOCUS55635 [Hexamita inflata]